MNSLQDVWQSVLDILAQDVTDTAMNTWFSDCRPIELSDRRLVLQTTNDFKRTIIKKRFGDTICSVMGDLFSCDIELVVLVGDEVDEYALQSTRDDLPEAAAYTFDRFIVGKSNELAYAAAVGVAKKTSSSYNPLFIYGNSGLGKTHLMLAIGQYTREHESSAKIAYVKGEDFLNQMVRSIQEKSQEEFRQRYRYVDLLLIDDIQIIAGKPSTQLEFFNTFNSIHDAGHQIVMTSDRPPMEMTTLEDRLRSRFEGGLLVDIQPPDFETRVAIVRDKSQSIGLLLPDKVINYIAENITANIRQIEGVINRLTALRDLHNEEVTIEMVDRAMKDIAHIGIFVPTPQIIIAETARFFDQSEEDLRGQRRSKNTALARQVAMYLIRRLTNLPLVDIGEEFENRNHSTVLSSIRKIEEMMKRDGDKQIADVIRDITSNINARN